MTYRRKKNTALGADKGSGSILRRRTGPCANTARSQGSSPHGLARIAVQQHGASTLNIKADSGDSSIVRP